MDRVRFGRLPPPPGKNKDPESDPGPKKSAASPVPVLLRPLDAKERAKLSGLTVSSSSSPLSLSPPLAPDFPRVSFSPSSSWSRS